MCKFLASEASRDATMWVISTHGVSQDQRLDGCFRGQLV
jgi:hypothetical protein